MYHIIISPEWFPNKENLLSAIFTKRHIDIISRKHKVVVAFASASKFEKSNYNLVIEDGDYSTVICYFKTSKLPFLNKYIDFLKFFIAHYKAIKRANSILGEVDFFHVHVLPKAAIIPFCYFLLKGVPYFISEHATAYLRKSPNFLENGIKSILSKYSKGLSSVSSSLKLGMIDKGLNHLNFKIIPNVVDANLFTLKHSIKNEKVRFLHVSRLEEKAKNTKGILRTFNLLFSKHKDIELHIVGGLLNKMSDAEIFANGLVCRRSIFFHGVKFGSEIIPFYQNADYFVMFSNYETQAVVILEALMCGLPVIATRLPALNEYLHSGNSLQVDVNDESELFNKMELCMTNSYGFWEPINISEEIKLKFNIEKIESGFEDLYHQGLNL